MKLHSIRLTGQFSLRHLILVISLIGVGLFPLAVRMDACRRQQQAISRLERNGILIGYADPRPKAESFESAAGRPLGQPAHRGLASTLLTPVDFVCAVQYQAGAAGLSPIIELSSVSTIAYVNSKVTGEIVDLFSRMPSLTTLNLSDTDLDDEALMRFAQIESLEYISIMGTRVTPEAVLEFKRARPDCTISSDLDTRFLLCLQRLLELRASKSN